MSVRLAAISRDILHPAMYFLYWLNCAHDVVYIGVTVDFRKRLLQHFARKSPCSVTRKFRPLSWFVISKFSSEREVKIQESALVRDLRQAGIAAYGGCYTQLEPCHWQPTNAAIDRLRHL